VNNNNINNHIEIIIIIITHFSVGHLTTLDDRTIIESRTIGGERTVRGNHSTRDELDPVPFRPPRIPHHLTWDRTWIAAVVSQPLTA
jgi:hypothetical protein